MDHQTMVMCGEWRCGREDIWEFIVDKQHFGRVVSIKDNMSLVDLKRCCMFEFFGYSEGEYSVFGLSYWPPNSLELATGLKTPPVLLTSDGGIEFFLKHLRVNGCINLCVSFVRTINQNHSKSLDGSSGFRTPGQQKSCQLKLDAICNLVGDAEGVASCSGSRTKPVLLDDDQMVKAAELVEARLSRESVYLEDSDDNEWEEEICAMHEGDVSEAVGIEPRGYDTEFWGPLIESVYGGSNAVEIMFNDVDVYTEVPPLKSSRLTDSSSEGGISGGSFQLEMVVAETNHIPGFDLNLPEQGSVDVNVSPATNMRPRSLDDVDDDEFDLQPLFDDTQYECDEIPDLDVDGGEDHMHVGKQFGSKSDCQIALAIYAIKQQFYFKQTTTKRDYFVVTCADTKCDWRVMAKEVSGGGYYEIRKANLTHSCPLETRDGYKRKATSQVIGHVFKSKYGAGLGGPKPMDLQQLVLEELRLTSSYMKCYRAREKAIFEVRGTEEESYTKLPIYLHMLKLANPGTVTHLETRTDEDGVCRFLYTFLAFGASIVGFRRVRRVLVVDGTHLTGKYKGVLLTASGQDANCQVYPLAFAVVDSENVLAWTWFFEKLELIIADSSQLTIISDRHGAIYAAKNKVFPKAHHGACLVHVARNVSSTFQHKGLGRLVITAGFAYKVGAFRAEYAKIRAISVRCADYLAKMGIAHWARAYFAGERYNIMTSNIAEQLNKALKTARREPIVELLRFIQAMMSRWFCARRKKASMQRGILTPEVDKQLTKIMATMKGSKVNSVSSWSCEILGIYGARNHVQLKEKKCSCKAYDKLKLPCGHALIAADSLGVPIGTLADDCFKNTSWQTQYALLINPDGDPNDVILPEDVMSLMPAPPKTRRPSGRPKEVRIPSKGEFGTKTKKSVANRCTRCHLEGHNRSTCKNPI